MRLPLAPLAALPLLLAACASDPRPLDAAVGAPDVAADVGTEAGAPDVPAIDRGLPLDVGRDVDTGTDGPLPPVDLGVDGAVTDLGQDAPADIGSGEAAVDAGPRDAGTDAPTDAGAVDVGPDVPAGFVACVEGGATVVVDPRSNYRHCGACGHNCCGAFCINGACAAEGPPGTVACPISPAEEAARGCFSPIRVEARSDRNHCGGCDVRCASGQECVNAACVTVAMDAGPGDVPADRPDVPACPAGFADCDGNPANGCETDTRSSTTHCGLCGNGCAPGQTCDNGFCSIPPCSAGFGNCDGLAPNGCETDTRTSASHCGMCGRACAAGQLCAAGACVEPPCTNDAIRCAASGSGVERCVAGAWTLIRTCTASGLPSGSSASCYQGGCAYCLGVDGGPSCGEATCRDDEDCYRVREGRCVDGRCSRRGILPCVDDSACLPWTVSGVGSACTFTATDLNGASVRSCTGSLVAPCTTDAMCPRAHRCDLRSGTCRPT